MMPSFRITRGAFIQRNLKVTAENCPTKTQDIPSDNRDGCKCDLMIQKEVIVQDNGFIELLINMRFSCEILWVPADRAI